MAAEEPPSLADIQRWVDELQSDQYQDREAATAKLVAAGQAAIQPIVEALKQNDLEMTTRGVDVLLQLAQQRDLATAEAAREALEKKASLRITTAARVAAEALERLDVVRHKRTIGELRELGAVLSLQPASNAGYVPEMLEEQFVVEIGDRWRGKPEDLRRIAWLQNVAEVILEGKQVDDSWLENLPVTDALKNLSIKRASISGQSLKLLEKHKQLQSISLMYVPVADDGVPSLSRLQNLEMIRLYGVKISPEGLASLRTSLPRAQVDFRRGAFLGIGAQPGQQGCVVYTVMAGSAAAKAGFQVNDVVLTYEGKPVPNFEKLTEMIAENVPGDTVTMEIARGARRMTKRVTLGAWD